MNWMEISLPLLQSALQTLYGDPDPQVFTFSINKYLIWIIKNKYAAQKWLVKAQRDPSAWNWSFELLKDGNPTEGTVWNFDKVAINMNSSRDFQTEKVQYFGAIAIHYKITNCWVELPPDKVEDILKLDWISTVNLDWWSAPRNIPTYISFFQWPENGFDTFVYGPGSIGHPSSDSFLAWCYPRYCSKLSKYWLSKCFNGE